MALTREEPRMLFLHYWGRGPAEELARAFKRELRSAAGSACIVAAHARPSSRKRKQRHWPEPVALREIAEIGGRYFL